ncbi:MAG: amidohydrolase family protein [Cellvibrio sp.]
MIDAHQHFWQIGQHDCTWPTPDLAIYRNFMPEDFAPIADAVGIKGSVLVQSQESDLDTDVLLGVADESDLVKAVVGWVDLLSPVAASRIRLLSLHPKFRGIRPMLQGLEDDAWILKPEVDAAINELKACQLSFDALVYMRHLPYLHIFAERHPELAIVIDHAAKPAIAEGQYESWAKAIAALSQLPNVYCKLSGLLTEANAEQGAEDLKVYVSKLYELFGAERLMWGSDWPVLNLAANRRYAGYADWLALARKLLPEISKTEVDCIFGLTAKKFYGF